MDYDEITKDAPAAAQAVFAYLDKEEYTAAKKAAMEMFVTAVEKSSPKDKMYAIYALAKEHLLTGEFHEAKELVAKKLLLEPADDKLKASISNLLAKISLAMCDYEAAEAAVEEATSKAKGAKSVAAEASAACTLAKVKLGQDKKQEALKFAKQATALFSDSKDKVGEMYALKTEMTILISLKKGEEAIRAANLALGIFEGSGDADMEAAAYLMVADARIAGGDYESAKEACSKASDCAIVSGNMYKKGLALMKLAEAQVGAEDPEDANASYQEAVEGMRAAGNRYGEATAIIAMAKADIEAGNAEDARFNAEEAEEICRKDKFKALLADALCTGADANMAMVYSGTSTDIMHNFNARTAGKEALTIYRAVRNKKGTVQALNILAAAFFEYGNYFEARAKAKLAVEISQDIGDTKEEGRSMLMVARTRLGDNKEEAVRLAKLAEKLVKESGDTILAKDAGEVLDFLRDYDPKAKSKDDGKAAAASAAQSAKSDYTLDFDYGKIRGVYFDAFTARALRTR
jgi:tetratricopeptide (TPR) repeat protein